MKKIMKILFVFVVFIALCTGCNDERIMTECYDEEQTTMIEWDGYWGKIPNTWTSLRHIENGGIIISLADNAEDADEIIIYNLGFTNDYSLVEEADNQKIMKVINNILEDEIDDIKESEFLLGKDNEFSFIKYIYTGKKDGEKIYGECIIFFGGKFAINCTYPKDSTTSYYNDMLHIAKSVKEIEYLYTNDYKTSELQDLDVMGKYRIKVPITWSIVNDTNEGFELKIDSKANKLFSAFISGCDVRGTENLENEQLQHAIKTNCAEMFSKNLDKGKKFTITNSEFIRGEGNSKDIYVVDFEGVYDYIRVFGKLQNFKINDTFFMLFWITSADDKELYSKDFNELINSFVEVNEKSSTIQNEIGYDGVKKEFINIVENSEKTKDNNLTSKVKDDFYWNFYDTNWYDEISDIVVYTDKTCDVILTNDDEAYTRAFSVYEIASRYGVQLVYAKDTKGNVLKVKN